MSAIIQWLQFVLLILAFGKKAVDLAVDIYERIEFWARVHAKTTKNTPEEKAQRFNRLYTLESMERRGLIPPLKRVHALREGVWKTRPENRGKTPKSSMSPSGG